MHIIYVIIKKIIGFIILMHTYTFLSSRVGITSILCIEEFFINNIILHISEILNICNNFFNTKTNLKKTNLIYIPKVRSCFWQSRKNVFMYNNYKLQLIFLNLFYKLYLPVEACSASAPETFTYY